jgi:hypothetical protein
MNHCFQHFGGRAPAVRIEVHHRTANVAHGDGGGGGIVCFTEGEHAAVVEATTPKAPIPVEPTPAQRGGIEPLAAHGFHRIAKDRFNLSNLDRHFALDARPRPAHGSRWLQRDLAAISWDAGR